jgi:hypothetical protein
MVLPLLLLLLLLLLLHLQVAEHGITAVLPGSSSSSSDPEPLGDISGGDSTWRAWKHVGLHTAQVMTCYLLSLSVPLTVPL